MKISSRTLRDEMTQIIKTGDIPYQSNRRAVEAFDIYRDDEEGRQELIAMLEGLDVFIMNLEIMGYDFETVARTSG
jgi:crotonobetainyl-CoA:carnitine CoA-transferase CaiB-like acyl-CoA transferase